MWLPFDQPRQRRLLIVIVFLEARIAFVDLIIGPFKRAPESHKHRALMTNYGLGSSGLKGWAQVLVRKSQDGLDFAAVGRVAAPGLPGPMPPRTT
jgi:hypothetical protein